MAADTFHRGGLRYRIETKVQRQKWEEQEHPRDRIGRWIETGAEVRVWGGVGGRVVRNVGGGRIEIQRTDGQHVIVHRNYLTVIKRPDGSTPTTQRRDDITPLAETDASADAVEVAIPETVTNVDTIGAGRGLDDALAGLDDTLARQVREAAANYQDALNNDTPDDEADERNHLIDVLDQVEEQYGDRDAIRDQAALLRTAAITDPSITSEAREKLDFVEIGRQAFRNGDPAAPSMNPQVVAALEGLPVGEPEGRRAMLDFIRGWTAANLAEPVPGVPTPSAPSTQPETQPREQRWNIEHPSDGGEGATVDGAALARSLRAAARATDSEADAAALRWAARKLMPPAPRSGGAARRAPREQASEEGRAEARAVSAAPDAAARRAAADARADAIADLADDLDQFGYGNVQVPPAKDEEPQALVAVMRAYVSSYREGGGGSGGPSLPGLRPPVPVSPPAPAPAPAPPAPVAPPTQPPAGASEEEPTGVRPAGRPEERVGRPVAARDLAEGDRIAVDGDTATVERIESSGGDELEIDYVTSAGESRMMFVDRNETVERFGSAPAREEEPADAEEPPAEPAEPEAPSAESAVPALPHQRDAARHIAAEADAADAETAVAAYLSPSIRRTGGMYPADAWPKIEKHPKTDRLVPLVLAAAAGIHGPTAMTPWNGERARAALTRLAEGDHTLPSASIGQRIRIDVIDHEARHRVGQPATTKPFEGVVQRVTAPTGKRGNVFVVVRDDNGDQQGQTFPADGTVALVEATEPEPEEQPEANPPDDAAILVDFNAGMSADQVADKYSITRDEAYAALARGRAAQEAEREAVEATRPPATSTELQDIGVGDVVRSGNRDYTVTRSEPTDRGRFWRIAGIADDGTPLDVGGVAPTQQWGRVSVAEPEPEAEVDEATTPELSADPRAVIETLPENRVVRITVYEPGVGWDEIVGTARIDDRDQRGVWVVGEASRDDDPDEIYPYEVLLTDVTGVEDTGETVTPAATPPEPEPVTIDEGGDAAVRAANVEAARTAQLRRRTASERPVSRVDLSATTVGEDAEERAMVAALLQAVREGAPRYVVATRYGPAVETFGTEVNGHIRVDPDGSAWTYTPDFANGHRTERIPDADVREALDRFTTGPSLGAAEPASAAPRPDPLAGFSPAEQARIRNAATDDAASYFGGVNNFGRADAVRYTAEGPLGDLADRHGLGRVMEGVDAVISEDESVLTRSQEERDQIARTRDSRLEDLNQAAATAATSGDIDEALRLLDEMETLDPLYRPGNRSIDDLREVLRAAQDRNAAAAAPRPEPEAAPVRRFADVAAVRAYLRDLDIGKPEVNRRIADDPELTLSAQGRLIVHRNPSMDGRRVWRISTPSGIALPLSGGTRDEALELANLIEQPVDAEGSPFPFDADDVQSRVRGWVDADGNNLAALARAARERVLPKNSRRRDWQDPWARGEAPAQVDEDAKRVYTSEGGEEAEADGETGATSREALPTVATEGVPATERPDVVLRESGGGGGEPDRGAGGPPGGPGPGERTVPGEGGPVPGGAPLGGGTGGEGVPAAGAGAGRREAEPGGPGAAGGTGRLPGGRGRVRRDTSPVDRTDDAGEAPDDVTEADQPPPNTVTVDRISAAGQNFRPAGIDDLAPAGKVAKLTANMDALRTLRMLQRDQRPATAEEQAVLARWAGWGGLPEVFDENRPEFATQREELRGLLSDAEWREARRNTLNAHYTDARVVQALWDAVRDLGFDGGRVLEPGSGSGTFIGFAPGNAEMVGVELDSTTAALSQYLYPGADIRNESFADTNIPDGAFDLTIGNVPFGKFALTDRRHNPDGESIHNHFILKSLDLTRPGGLVAVLTSRYTLDSQDAGARRKMAEKADLVGAIRLPSGSHQRASGTGVIEDILIFRRRPDGDEPQADQSWVNAQRQEIDDQTVTVNDYWDKHPENVLGEIHAEKGQFGTGDMVVRGDRDMPNLASALAGLVADARSEGLTATPSEAEPEARPELLAAGSGRHEGHIRVEEDGTFTQAVGGAAVPIDVPATQTSELRALVGLRDALSSLLDAEYATTEDTQEIADLRADLNRQYDAYVDRYGPVNRFKLTKTGARSRPGQGGFRRDPMSATVRALETYNPVDGTAVKAAIFTQRGVARREPRTTADTPADALALSMDTYNEVNLPAIASMLGVDEPTARDQLAGLVFEQPPLTDAEVNAAFQADAMRLAGALAGIDTAGGGVDLSSVGESVRREGGLVPAAEYLSGNVRRKLAAARAAAEHDPRFKANVDALEAVLPADLGPDEIDGRLGAAWINADTVKAFLTDLLQDRYGQVKVVHSGGSIWTVEGPSRGNLATEEWGTQDRSAPQLVQSLLEQRSIKITRKVGDKSVPDLEATLAAQAKAEAIQERFSEWLWEDADRSRRLQARYNEQFNSIVLRTYDGSTRSFPGMAEGWQPRSHQRNAVERIVNEPTVLLGHVVGAGKTAEMVMGSSELRRLGLARKPAIVVPNHMLEQFSREYLEVYPQAKLLAAGSEDLQGENRREFVARAATGDWDAVILTQGAFESIPMSTEQQQAYIDRELATMRLHLDTAEAQATEHGDSAQQKTVKKMEAALLRAEEALKKKLAKTKDVGVTFEQTGIDYLMVDEAHGYSNLRALSNIQGAGTTGSDRATDLHMKLEYLRENSQSGRVATFATGTPIRNTVTQAYVMQNFLRPDLLEEAGIHSFDQWAATFGQTVDEMELKPEGTGFRQTTRFAKFRNVPELLRQFHTFADIKLAEDLDLPTPDLEGGGAQTVTVLASDSLRAYIADLGERAEMVRSGSVKPEDDNMLKISTDGRKAALSMKLVGQEHEPGKIEAAADRIAAIWEQDKDTVYTDPKTGEDDPITGGLQIVFLDMGTPGSGDGWNGYDTLKSELVARGMNPDSIRFIHEAKNDAQKAEMFAAARSGRVSVLIGSSEKMGVGTNIQRRALALHHLDAPWRPSDVEQRDGRIMRQGNLNPSVQILRYVTEGSFDAYMWQTLERKAKFINQIMRGSLDVREIEDVGDTAMSYAEVKALATGNPDLLEAAKTETLLTKLERLARTHARTQTNLVRDVEKFTLNGALWSAHASAFDEAVKRRVNTRGEAFTMTVAGQRFSKRSDAADAMRARLQTFLHQDRYSYDPPEREIGTIGGFRVLGQVQDRPGGKKIIALRFADVPGDIASASTDDLRVSGPGLVTRLENGLESFEVRRDRLTESAEDARTEVRRMRARIGQAFPRQAELEAVRLKAERLKLKMERDALRADGREIEFDPLIDTDQYDAPILRGGTVVSDEPPAPDTAVDDFGAVTAADLRRAAEARAKREERKTLAVINGRIIVTKDAPATEQLPAPVAGRVRVLRDTGDEVVVDAGNVTVVPVATEPASDTPPEAPQQTPDAPAPDAEPEGAFAVLTTPDGAAMAWLRIDEDDQPIGYLRLDADDPATTIRFGNAQQWAAEVDGLGMQSTAGKQTRQEQVA